MESVSSAALVSLLSVSLSLSLSLCLSLFLSLLPSLSLSVSLVMIEDGVCIKRCTGQFFLNVSLSLLCLSLSPLSLSLSLSFSLSLSLFLSISLPFSLSVCLSCNDRGWCLHQALHWSVLSECLSLSSVSLCLPSLYMYVSLFLLATTATTTGVGLSHRLVSLMPIQDTCQTITPAVVV